MSSWAVYAYTLATPIAAAFMLLVLPKFRAPRASTVPQQRKPAGQPARAHLRAIAGGR